MKKIIPMDSIMNMIIREQMMFSMMFNDLYHLEKITKQQLLSVLKHETDNINITDIMIACTHLKEENKYVQANYREQYDHIYIESFLMRIKKLREDNNKYEGFVDIDELHSALETLKKQEVEVRKDSDKHLCFFNIYKLITIYDTFILDEPVHPVGMPFPGGFKIKYEDGIYFCPVKENQKNNPGAVCGICIAEQDKDVKK